VSPVRSFGNFQRYKDNLCGAWRSVLSYFPSTTIRLQGRVGVLGQRRAAEVLLLLERLREADDFEGVGPRTALQVGDHRLQGTGTDTLVLTMLDTTCSSFQ
jgi:hypothetical protein